MTPSNQVADRRRGRSLGSVLAVLAGVAILAGLLVGARASAVPSDQDAAVAVVAGLRCPSCEAESAAASQSGAAREMRAVAAVQLAAGRTPAEVRAWFAAQYGDAVLLDPPARGAGLIAWLVPALAVPLGVAGLLWAGRRRGRRLLLPVAATTVVAAAAVTWAVAAAPGTPPPPSDSPAYASELDTALTALVAGDVRTAQERATAVLVTAPDSGPAQAEALLVLGLAERQAGDPAASATLNAFLDLAPHHAAAERVRALLAGAAPG